MHRSRLFPILCLGLALAAQGAPAPATLVEDARIVDGTGAPGVVQDLRLRDGVIVALGELAPEAGERVVDGTGLVLAPGFVDTHSHHDADADPLRVAATSQGITTIVVGQDGGSPWPLADFLQGLERAPVAVNVAAYAGHGTLRDRILGEDWARPATAAEVRAMETLLAEEMAAGALGLSTGLEYDPGIHATTEEVIALARVARRWGGRYISHVRSEDRALEAAVEELIEIGRAAEIPVQLTHMKLARRGLWGQAERFLARLDAARAEGVDVTVDVYPYEYWSSSMTVLFPERDFDNPASARYALTELVAPEEMLLGRFDPEPSYAGRSLAEVADTRDEDPVTTYLALLAMLEASGARGGEYVVARSMTEQDIRAILAWPHANVCSDGSGEGAHPRGHGAFPRVLARYVREEGVLDLETAIHKMTLLAARHVGLADRGVIALGAPADLVLLDPETVADRATFEAPHRLAVGIREVWVNGESVYRNGAATGARPGRPLRR